MCLGAHAQKVYKEDNKNSADYVIYFTGNKSEADCIIKLTEWSNRARDGYWQFVDWESISAFTVYITFNKSEADKLIYITEWDTQVDCNLK